MDEATAELLSRYLDGDLDAGQARLLEQRLAAEPALEAELAALRQLQLQVRSVADRMALPAELDAPFARPDRGSARRPARIPPAVRWLGLAAGVALAVTVAVEVARRPAQLAVPATVTRPLEPTQTAKAQAPEPRPAPLRDEAAETDAAPPAGPAPPAPEGARRRLQPPEKKELSLATQPQSTVATGRAATAPAESSVEGELHDRGAPPSPGGTVAAVAAAPTLQRAKAAGGNQETAAESFAGRGAALEDVGGLFVELTGADGASLATLALPAGSAVAGSRLVVTVAAGVIVGVTPDGDSPPAEAAADELIGRRLAGLPDGRYRGVVAASAPLP